MYRPSGVTGYGYGPDCGTDGYDATLSIDDGVWYHNVVAGNGSGQRALPRLASFPTMFRTRDDIDAVVATMPGRTGAIAGVIADIESIPLHWNASATYKRPWTVTEFIYKMAPDKAETLIAKMRKAYPDVQF